MRYYIVLAIFLVFCIGTVTAEIPCGTDSCSGCSINSGIIDIYLHNSAGFMSSSDKLVVDGVTLTPTDIIYSDTEHGFVVTLPAGVHTLAITATGYTGFNDKVHVCEYKRTRVDFTPVKSVSLGKIGINSAAVKIPTATTTAASSGGSSQSGGAFSNVPLPTTTAPSSGSTVPAQAGSSVTQAAATPQPDTLGSLSVKTEPAGAFIFIDGVQRGVTPATIPGISAGTHTLLLKLNGYQDITTPVTITAGRTQEYSSAMAKVAATTEETAAATATPKKSPGFAFVLALAGLGAVLCMRKGRAG
jgi:hypothetical protein